MRYTGWNRQAAANAVRQYQSFNPKWNASYISPYLIPKEKEPLKTFDITLEVDVTVMVSAENLDNAISQARVEIKSALSRFAIGGFGLLDHECLSDWEETDEEE